MEFTERQFEIIELVITGQRGAGDSLANHFSKTSGPQWMTATPSFISAQLGGPTYPSENLLTSVFHELRELQQLGFVRRVAADEWVYSAGPISQFFEQKYVYHIETCACERPPVGSSSIGCP